MEENSISELENELNQIDVDSIKLDAIIQLKTWQKKMYSVINKTYTKRLHEIESIATNLTNEIKEKQDEIENRHIDNQNDLMQLKNEIDLLKTHIVIDELIPDNFEQRLERMIRVSRENEDDEFAVDDDDDDAPVIVDIDRREVHSEDRVIVAASTPATHDEGRVSKILNSQPIQHALAVGLAKTLVNVGTIAATSTTTVAATTMAKTALIATVCGVGTVAYGVGRLAMGTTRKIYSLVVTTDE